MHITWKNQRHKLKKKKIFSSYLEFIGTMNVEEIETGNMIRVTIERKLFLWNHGLIMWEEDVMLICFSFWLLMICDKVMYNKSSSADNRNRNEDLGQHGIDAQRLRFFYFFEVQDLDFNLSFSRNVAGSIVSGDGGGLVDAYKFRWKG